MHESRLNVALIILMHMFIVLNGLLSLKNVLNGTGGHYFK